MATIKLAIVGLGKIARDQHLPQITANADFVLAAIATRQPLTCGVPTFTDISALAASGLEVDAVSICTPPQGRHKIARTALEAGFHVMLEKPPGAAVSEVRDLEALARERNLVLFTSWHSREAASAAPARAWLAQRRIISVTINWKEDVRHWHPGQTWLWQAGGMGVFDPGINALSLLTAILPVKPFVTSAELMFPGNCDAPIAANLEMRDVRDTPIRAEFDFLQTGEQIWEIAVETDAGQLQLTAGGSKMHIDGQQIVDSSDIEYAGLYRRFAQLVGSGERDVDLSPLELVADAFMLGRRTEVAPFIE